MTDDRITGYSTENVAPLTPPDLELLGELTRQLPRVPTELTCPIRDCPGHEGPHGSLNAETWTSAGDCE